MSVLIASELPPAGHVMAIVDSMNKSNFLKFCIKTPVSSESLKSFGASTSLVRTRSSVSLSSSSFDISSSIECEFGGNDYLELEALYDDRFQPTCQSTTLLRSHNKHAKHVCVCSKKKCSFGSRQKKLSKSLSDLQATANEKPIRKKSFRKYFTLKLEKDSAEKVMTVRASKALPSTSSRKLPTLKTPMETFEIIDTCDSAPKPTKAKKRSKFSNIRKLKRDEQPIAKENNVNGVVNFPISENMNGGVLEPSEGVEVQTKAPSKNWKQKSKHVCKLLFKFRRLTPLRIILIVLGVIIFLTGASYDIALRHGVDSAFSSCWNRLKDEYRMFGTNFIKYQEYVFRNKGKPNLKTKEFDENFLSILENTEFSFQMHFFGIKEGMAFQNSKVVVKDTGPLYFKIYFKRDRGLEVKYINDKSNISLTSPFEVYDIMKALLLSNQLPYFGFHIKDHYKTTPTALLKMFIDNLNKFEVDTSFFSTLQSQIIGSANKQRSRRSLDVDDDSSNSIESLLDEIFLPLPMDTSKRVDVSVPSLRRNLSLTFQNSEYVSGIERYRFILRDITSFTNQKWTKSDDRTYSSNDLFKFKPYKGRDDKSYINSVSIYSKKEQMPSTNNFSLPRNVINLNPVLLKTFGNVFFLGKYLEVYPFWMSSPHFILSKRDKDKKNLYFRDYKDKLDRIEGFDPDESRHGSYIYYHPLLGIPINASLAVQIGIYPPDGMLYANKLVPVVWIRVQLDKIHPTLWFFFWASFYIRGIFIITFIITGLSIITCALKCSCGKKCDEQMV